MLLFHNKANGNSNRTSPHSTPNQNSLSTVGPGGIVHFNLLLSRYTMKIGFFLIITVCQRSNEPFYVVNYNIKRATTSWTYSMMLVNTWMGPR